jgi:hypothetical protein
MRWNGILLGFGLVLPAPDFSAKGTLHPVVFTVVDHPVVFTVVDHPVVFTVVDGVASTPRKKEKNADKS